METKVSQRRDSLVLEQVRPATARAWPLDRDRLTLGRDESCDIVVDDAEVSRRHAELVRQGLTWTVIDLESTNGTSVNGSKVESAAIQPGDRIAVGESELVVRERDLTPAKGQPKVITYDVESQSGVINNVGGNQTNTYSESSLRYIANRRGAARKLIMWGIALFFIGQAIGITAVLSFQNDIFSSFDSTSPPDLDVSPAFVPAVGVGALLSLLGVALFIYGLVARSGAKREARRIGAQW